MKFTCSTKDIASAVGAASKIVNAHTTVPILSNVLLTADESGIKVRATDLELTLEQSFPAEISEHGAVTVPAKLFSGYLGNLPAGLLELTGSPTRASIKAERSNYDFLALPPDEYPPLPTAQKGASFGIAAKKFRDGVNSTIFAASSEEARGAVLMGTLLELEGSSITLVATDGYRLAKWTGTLDRPFEGAAKYIVPSRALAEAARNIGAAEMLEATALGAQANQLMLTAGTTSIVVRLVDGQYPNYGQVIPAKFDRSVTVNTSALIGGLRRAELVAGDRASMVKLESREQHADDHGQIRYYRQRLRRTRSRADRRRSHDRVQRALPGRNTQPRRLAGRPCSNSSGRFRRRRSVRWKRTISARSFSC